jgi:hypothetical protein
MTISRVAEQGNNKMKKNLLARSELNTRGGDKNAGRSVHQVS